jgi:hypothetical protein
LAAASTLLCWYQYSRFAKTLGESTSWADKSIPFAPPEVLGLQGIVLALTHVALGISLKTSG